MVIIRQIVAVDGGRIGLAPARRYKSASTGGGTSFAQPAIAVYSFTPPARPAPAPPRPDDPGLPRPLIRSQTEQFQQVAGGGYLRRGRRRQYWRRFAKDQFTLDFAAGQLTCPAGVTMPVEPGKAARFPKDAASSNGCSVSIHPDEVLPGPQGHGDRPGRERWSLPVHPAGSIRSAQALMP